MRAFLQPAGTKEPDILSALPFIEALANYSKASNDAIKLVHSKVALIMQAEKSASFPAGQRGTLSWSDVDAKIGE